MTTEVDKTKKREFFFDLGYSVRDSIRVQDRLGLFVKKPLTEERITDVSRRLERVHQAPEHMLVVTARCVVLADWLGIDEGTKRNLALAASLHDAFKVEERKITSEAGFTWDSFEVAEDAATKKLMDLGVAEDLINLSQAAGHPINEAQKLLVKDDLSDQDWAWAILHYIDMATKGNEWAVYDPIESRLSRDEKVYTGFDKSSVGKIEGHLEERGFQAMRRTGGMAESRLAMEIETRLGKQIDPKNLLVLVDEEIKRRITEY